MNDSQERGTYLTDLEVRRLVKLQGVFEVALNLTADLELRLPDRLMTHDQTR